MTKPSSKLPPDELLPDESKLADALHTLDAQATSVTQSMRRSSDSTQLVAADLARKAKGRKRRNATVVTVATLAATILIWNLRPLQPVQDDSTSPGHLAVTSPIDTSTTNEPIDDHGHRDDQPELARSVARFMEKSEQLCRDTEKLIAETRELTRTTERETPYRNVVTTEMARLSCQKQQGADPNLIRERLAELQASFPHVLGIETASVLTDLELL